jgi:hypothetical protein
VLEAQIISVGVDTNLKDFRSGFKLCIGRQEREPCFAAMKTRMFHQVV